ncbi:hypothetical protein A3B56_02430 [Candidatus Roizmanbacteria bacterium RIFCSPLOWO2_01_FULL_45_11]|uniref:Uncharacterized protein n=1 Tax=Candidatus Roizmanbacteria bacterium RIFCSPLOWO2_01_FULL_45_11 TaxID=1802070 RepID=A0A1F7JIY6_9BACT|nr:MAG: hypothetical protein A3B56_02430 [Candidatus Roizmanbacteria bacterium RIFCSPLOWO2_01_FULL_45_11]
MNSKDLLFISIVTFLTTIAWTVYDIYHTAVTSTITPVQQELIKPINPGFDQETLELLRTKEV